MSGLTLHLDVERWRRHLRSVADTTPGLVPVVKGNGYGFGLRRLAEEAARLGVDALAVGVADEVAAVRDVFPGTVVILNPWDAANPTAVELAEDPKVLTTVSRLEDLAALADLETRPRVLVELLTSMRRHGIDVNQLDRVALLLDRVKFEGWSIHLPLDEQGRRAETERLAQAASAAAPGALWISHLPPEDASAVIAGITAPGQPPVPLRLRSGTRLWLGDPGSRRTTATVMDVHTVTRGQRVGYRQRKAPAAGHVVVVAGGTSHGVGLEAPTSASTLRQRAIALAGGGLEATGRALSPYTVDGRKRWFLEPPHMQSSQLFLPKGVTPPERGDEVPIELRLTTATVDRIAEV
jgi:alanine racemase